MEMTLDPLNEREYDLTTMVKVSDGSGDRSFEGDEKHLYETGVEKSVDKQLTMIATAMSLKEDEMAVLRVKLKEDPWAKKPKKSRRWPWRRKEAPRRLDYRKKRLRKS